MGLPWWCSGNTSPSNAGGAGSIPVQEAKISTCLIAKKLNIKTSNIVTNSIKALKMVHMKKKKKTFKKKKKRLAWVPESDDSYNRGSYP